MINAPTPELGLKNLRSASMEMRLKNENSFPYAGIWLFTGVQGSGKTLLMMHCLKQMIEEYPDAIVVSNISIYGTPSYVYRGIEDFKKYKNGAKGTIFVIDEIHTLFSSLQSANMPESTLTVWSQNRKNRRVILGTSQRFTRVAKGIREQCTYNYECKNPIFGRIFSYTIREGDEYDDNGKYVGEEPSQRYFYIPNVNVMRMYNTLEVVTKDNVSRETSDEKKEVNICKS